jgi:hypothetical protein
MTVVEFAKDNRELLFSGGITPDRVHFGDDAGLASLEPIVLGLNGKPAHL